MSQIDTSTDAAIPRTGLIQTARAFLRRVQEKGEITHPKGYRGQPARFQLSRDVADSLALRSSSPRDRR